jgi:hypothetical protein
MTDDPPETEYRDACGVPVRSEAKSGDLDERRSEDLSGNEMGCPGSDRGVRIIPEPDTVGAVGFSPMIRD